MGSSGGGGSTSGMTDFPDYMKEFHGALLNHDGADAPVISVIDAFNQAASGNSPYYAFITNTEPIAQAFFGAGKTVNSYSKIYELLKVYQELDWTGLVANSTAAIESKLPDTATTVEELLQAVSIALDDEIQLTVLPRFKSNIRSIGAVNSSAFVIGESLIWDSKIKAIAKERLNIEQIMNQKAQVVLSYNEFGLKMALSYIDFQKSIPTLTMDITKYYYALKTDLEDHYSALHAKDLKWDLDLFQYVNNTLSSISGAALAQGTPDKAPSKVASAIGGALSGAAMGATVGGAPGAVVGGLVGLAGGLLG